MGGLLYNKLCVLEEGGVRKEIKEGGRDWKMDTGKKKKKEMKWERKG